MIRKRNSSCSRFIYHLHPVCLYYFVITDGSKNNFVVAVTPCAPTETRICAGSTPAVFSGGPRFDFLLGNLRAFSQHFQANAAASFRTLLNALFRISFSFHAV